MSPAVSAAGMLLALAVLLRARLVLAAMDAADNGAGSAADALVRVLDAAAQVAHRYSVLLAKISSMSISSKDDHDIRLPVPDPGFQGALRVRTARRMRCGDHADRGIPARHEA